MVIITIFFGFFLGALTIIAIQALGVLYLVRRFNQKIERQKKKADAALSVYPASFNSTGEVSVNYPDLPWPSKQGLVWILESEKIPVRPVADKGARDQKRKKDVIDVTPVRKFAKIKDQTLILRESDGSHVGIWLKGCIVVAVSAARSSTRKWAKRYPIKVENKGSVIYRGSKIIYIYLETSEDKELWCKSLRIASCEDNEKLKLFAKLRNEFHSYLSSLQSGHASFMKPFLGFNHESIDKSMKLEDGPSKVRRFFRKLSRKSSKISLENNNKVERKSIEKSRSFNEPASAHVLVKRIPRGRTRTYSAEENLLLTSIPNWMRSDGSDVEPDDNANPNTNNRLVSDEGTLCVNMLISRLFFDAKSNAEIKSLMQSRIQRSLSNLRSPSYIGEITCTGINPGNLPPYIHSMRVLPSDMNEVVALEVEIEYSGGVMLDIETRIEVRELDSEQQSTNNMNQDSSNSVTPGIVEGIEYLGKQLKLPEGTTTDEIEHQGGDTKQGKVNDETKQSKNNTRQSSSVSRWKSFRNSIAKQFSQVPLVLGIRVAALRGTLRIHIKPPPSDQIWFGFTTMPDVEFNLESHVGDRKINNGQVALFLNNRFKAAIRETMVLPNSESIAFPWMLAEKDDWVPREAAPYMWVYDPTAAHHDDPTAAHHDDPTAAHHDDPIITEPANQEPSHKMAKECSYESENYKDIPGGDQPNEDGEDRKGELSEPLMNAQNENQMSADGDETVRKKMGAKARMLSLKKRVGDKIEEKRRHLEFRSKSMVERMKA